MTHSPRLRRFVGTSSRFLTIGALSTVIEVAVFNVLVYAFDVNVVWAKVVASLVALVNAYFGNREWTFRGRGQHARMLELTLFLTTNGLCTGLGAAIVWSGLLVFPRPEPLTVNLINIVSIGFVVVARFVLYHYVVFRGPRARLEVIDDATHSERT